MIRNKQLRRLRRRVCSVDHELIRLLAQRSALASRIGAIKLDLGRPIRDVKTEATVIKNALGAGRARGLQSDLVRSVFQTIIAGSRHEQQKIYDAAPARKKENILVVGGGGGMGKWLTTFLHRRGHQVSVHDPNRRGLKYRAYRTLETGFRNSSLALICVPLDRVGPVVDRLAERDYPGIVCDIASIKGHVAGSLRAAGKRGLAITSIHPLFGPGTKSLDRKTICLCSCGSRRADERIRALFHGPEIRLVAVSLEDHDRLISYVLGLSHFVNLIFGAVLVRSGYPYRLLAMVASTTFQRQVETAQSVLRENPGLYYAIQRLNPFRDRLYADLIKTTRRVTEIVASGRKSEFARFMKSGRAWLSNTRPRS